MIFKQTIIAILLLFVLISPLIAANHMIVDTARLVSLSSHPTWINLLHYEPAREGMRSSIHSNEFFLSEQGKTNPYLELISTITHFNSPISGDMNLSSHCRFPARLLWLRKMLGTTFAPNLSINDCTNFRSWSQNDDIESVSMIFATGYLGNPASFYGHTLLKFNSVKTPFNTDLENSSINYGAIVPPNENPVVYIAKGLFGGYEAGFSHIQYYFHNHNYGENELRDMWEYELNLSKEDVRFLVAHSWEVLGKKYTYYFLKKNCAYRMAELFKIIEGLNIMPDSMLWTYPQTLIQHISSLQYNERKFVKSIKLHPSRQSRLYNKYKQLSNEEKELLSLIIKDKGFINTRRFSEINMNKQYRIVDVLLDYYQLIRDPSRYNDDPSNTAYKQLLTYRFNLPPGKSIFLPINNESGPHLGRDPSLASLNIIHHSKEGYYQHFNLRPSYYDRLDAFSGHKKFSHLSMAELGVSYFDDKLVLDYFYFIKIQSINSQASNLPGDSGFAWNLGAGWEKFTPECLDCSIMRLQGDIGISKVINSGIIFAAYAGGALHQSTKEFRNNFFLRTTIFSQVNLSDQLRLKVSYEYRDYLEAISIREPNEFIEATIRYQVHRDWDSRLFFRDGVDSEIGLSLGYYW